MKNLDRNVDQGTSIWYQLWCGRPTITNQLGSADDESQATFNGPDYLQIEFGAVLMQQATIKSTAWRTSPAVEMHNSNLDLSFQFCRRDDERFTSDGFVVVVIIV
ncbi:hypothetical protein Nepgr_009832 [Nepenthes gracilis]|uniref:Uncharacterized protein n=1 Tax=Nepenthes gracilis TaxID=150966 RepID=A0AAD3XKI1_NEPGR|nr:hypothetical protein Nepgr_009832 [Nepenthes gracilis]